jgi:WXXGXW repeat (2 copies)
MNTRLTCALMAGLLGLGTACVVGPRGHVAVVAPVPVVRYTYVEREPPPVHYERLPEPPTREHHWVAGHWQWNGQAYLWVPGHYQARPRAGVLWINGRWERHERGWYWIEGHWQ